VHSKDTAAERCLLQTLRTLCACCVRAVCDRVEIHTPWRTVFGADFIDAINCASHECGECAKHARRRHHVGLLRVFARDPRAIRALASYACLSFSNKTLVDVVVSFARGELQCEQPNALAALLTLFRSKCASSTGFADDCESLAAQGSLFARVLQTLDSLLAVYVRRPTDIERRLRAHCNDVLSAVAKSNDTDNSCSLPPFWSQTAYGIDDIELARCDQLLKGLKLAGD
jgi:hypothetical protein